MFRCGTEKFWDGKKWRSLCPAIDDEFDHEDLDDDWRDDEEDW